MTDQQTNNISNLTLQWAEKYLSLGWSMIPLKPKSKEPLIPWIGYQKRYATMEEIQSWLKKWPEMNLGIVTGKLSRLVVVDLDGKEGRTFQNSAKLVSPIISITGNGKQVFYKWTEHIDNSVAKMAPGVDIRGDGGYVVVCPSVHPTGKRYRWQRFVPQEIWPLPQILNQTKTETSFLTGQKENGWIAKALEEMKIGNIDDTLTSVLGRMRRDGYTNSDVRTLLLPHALAAGAEEGHLEDKIKNIWNRYEPKSVNGRSIFETNANGTSLHIHSPDNNDSFQRFTSSLDSNSHATGLKSGFPTLDKYFEGGLKSERLFTIAALTGVGKTNFGIALSANLCQQSKKVLYFSTEFQYQKVWTRYIATLKEPEQFREHPFYVVDSYSPTLEQVEEAIKQVMPDVFIFDFIQHIGKEKEVLTAFMRGCQFLQRKYNTQGVILAQLNRHADFVEDGKKIEPRLSMIEGSATLEQASSRVLLLQEIKVTPEMNEINGYLAKNDSGDRGLIHFALLKNPYRLVELI